MLQRYRELLMGLVVVAVSVSYVVWLRSRNENGEATESGAALAPARQPAEDLMQIASEDDIPGLTSILEFENAPTDSLADMVGRDPRMFNRGSSPERVSQLRELGVEFEQIAGQTEGDIETRREVAFAKYALTVRILRRAAG